MKWEKTLARRCPGKLQTRTVRQELCFFLLNLFRLVFVEIKIWQTKKRDYKIVTLVVKPAVFSSWRHDHSFCVTRLILSQRFQNKGMTLSK